MQTHEVPNHDKHDNVPNSIPKNFIISATTTYAVTIDIFPVQSLS